MPTAPAFMTPSLAASSAAALMKIVGVRSAKCASRRIRPDFPVPRAVAGYWRIRDEGHRSSTMANTENSEKDHPPPTAHDIFEGVKGRPPKSVENSTSGLPPTKARLRRSLTPPLRPAGAKSHGHNDVSHLGGARGGFALLNAEPPLDSHDGCRCRACVADLPRAVTLRCFCLPHLLHYHCRTKPYPIVEIDYVVIGHAETA
jgi:hypothetical protein